MIDPVIAAGQVVTHLVSEQNRHDGQAERKPVGENRRRSENLSKERAEVGERVGE